MVGPRRLQLRGRLLREGHQPVRGRGAGDLRDDADVRDDPRERRDRSRSRARSTSTTTRSPRTRAARIRSRTSRTPTLEGTGNHPQRRRVPHGRRVRRPAADRAAHVRAGALLLPVRLHREARGDRARRHRSGGGVLRVLRGALPAAAARDVLAAARREAHEARLARVAREHGLDGRSATASASA